jgi:hypothetical protein
MSRIVRLVWVRRRRYEGLEAVDVGDCVLLHVELGEGVFKADETRADLGQLIWLN